MSAKHLHFEKAFLPREWAKNRQAENLFPQILFDADMNPLVRDMELPRADMRFLPLRIVRRRKRKIR